MGIDEADLEATIPEPATLILIVLPLTSLGLIRRQRAR